MSAEELDLNNTGEKFKKGLKQAEKNLLTICRKPSWDDRCQEEYERDAIEHNEGHAVELESGQPGCHQCGDVVHPMPGYEDEEEVIGCCDRGVINFWRQKPTKKKPKDIVTLDKFGNPMIVPNPEATST